VARICESSSTACGSSSRARRLLPEVESLKREQNAAGDELAKAKKQGLDTTAQQERAAPGRSGSSSSTAS
jgi:outer membrane murein-binding lipoprotein Lpp